jgi:NADH-quinone oxidoreductase subunit M
MAALLLILIPLIAGLATFLLKEEKQIRIWVLAASVGTLVLSIFGFTMPEGNAALSFHAEWMQTLGSSFSVKLDGMGKLLCLLNAIAYPLVILATWNSKYKKPNNFFALMLLAQMHYCFISSGSWH